MDLAFYTRCAPPSFDPISMPSGYEHRETAECLAFAELSLPSVQEADSILETDDPEAEITLDAMGQVVHADAEIQEADGSLLTLDVADARFETAADGSPAISLEWDSAAFELQFNITATLTGDVACSASSEGGGWQGTVSFPLEQTSVKMAIMPSVPPEEAALDKGALPWLAGAVAKSIHTESMGALKLGPLVGTVYATVNKRLACSGEIEQAGSWLGPAASVQACAELCNEMICDHFAFSHNHMFLGQAQGGAVIVGSGGTSCYQIPSMIDPSRGQGKLLPMSCSSATAVPTIATFGTYRLVKHLWGASWPSARFWATHEQLMLNSQLISSIASDATGFCELREHFRELMLQEQREQGGDPNAASVSEDAVSSVASRAFARRHLKAVGGALVVHTRNGLDASLDAAESTAQLGAMADSVPEVLSVPPAMCTVTCRNGGKLTNPSIGAYNGPFAATSASRGSTPTTSQKLAIALSSASAADRAAAELQQVNSICPRVLAWLPAWMRPAECVRQGARDFALVYFHEVRLPLQAVGARLFGVRTNLSFAVCGRQPQVSITLALDGLPNSKLEMGPFGYGEPIMIDLFKPFYWEFELFSTASNIAKVNNVKVLEKTPQWLRTVLGFGSFGAGIKIALKLDGTLKKTVASIGLDLCAAMEAFPAVELVEVCLGQFDVISMLPIWLINDIEFEVSDICPTPIANISGATLPSALVQCLDDLEDDYATCGLSKSDADARFVHCAMPTIQLTSAFNTPPPVEVSPAGIVVDPLGLNKWWLTSLSAVNLPEAAIAELALTFDCETYAQAQLRACSCEDPIADAPPSSSSRVSAGALGQQQVRCIQQSIGMVADPSVTNHGHDLAAVKQRLDDLGYVAQRGIDEVGFPSELERLMRLFSCAADGVDRYEDACDDGVALSGQCKVNGFDCPSGMVTSHATCLRGATTPCALGRFAPGTRAFDWLRSSNAPGWLQLPSSGVGFTATNTPSATQSLWGTSWLAERLVRAGREYEQRRVENLRTSKWPRARMGILAASPRQGGMGSVAAITAAAGKTSGGFQTGLQLKLLLPMVPLTPELNAAGRPGIEHVVGSTAFDLSVQVHRSLQGASSADDAAFDRDAARLQIRSLALAGFNLTFDDDQLCIAEALCSMPSEPLGMKMDHFVATVHVPGPGQSVPIIHSARLLPDSPAEVRSRFSRGARKSSEFLVEIAGASLGASLEDVVDASIGGTCSCRAVQLSASKATLTVACSVDSLQTDTIMTAATSEEAAGSGSVSSTYGDWIRGEVTVTSARAGSGTGCHELSLFRPNPYAMNATGSGRDIPLVLAGSYGSDPSTDPFGIIGLDAGQEATMVAGMPANGWDRHYTETLSSNLLDPAEQLANIRRLSESSSYSLVVSSPVLMQRVTSELHAIRDAVDSFEQRLPQTAVLKTLTEVCAVAVDLKNRIAALVRRLGRFDRLTVGAALYEDALSLAARVSLLGTDDRAVRATMARCWEAEALYGSLAAGFIRPALALEQSTRSLASSLSGLQDACESLPRTPDNMVVVARLARGLEERRRALAGQQPLARMLAQVIRQAEGPLATLQRAVPHGTALSTGSASPLSGEVGCRAALAMDKLANRAKASLPALRLAAAPLGKMLVHAESILAFTSEFADAMATPEAFKEAIVRHLDRLVAFLVTNPAGPLGKGADLLKGLADKLFNKLGPLITKVFDFLDTLPGRLDGVLQFGLKLLARASDALKIEDALKLIKGQLNSKSFCSLMAMLKKFSGLASSIVEGFVPDGALKDKILGTIETVAMVSSPAELMENYIGPALSFLWSVSNYSNVISIHANQTLGPLRNWTESWVRQKMAVLQESGAPAAIDSLMVMVGNLSTRMVDELVEQSFDLGAELYEGLMPDFLPQLIESIREWVKGGYQTLQFAHQLVNNTKPLLHLLEMPKQLVHLACASPQCTGEAPGAPDFSRLAASTRDLFGSADTPGGSLGALAELPPRLSVEAMERSQPVSGTLCATAETELLGEVQGVLAAYHNDATAVRDVRPLARWYSTCGAEAAQRAKRLALPLQVLATLWRSLTHPGGFLYRLQRSVCLETATRDRHVADSDEPAPGPAYQVPDWLAPHFCDAATFLVEQSDHTNEWLAKGAENVMEKILVACNWAASQLDQLVERSAAAMGEINAKMQGVKDAASTILERLLPIHEGVGKIISVTDRVGASLTKAQRITEGAKSFMEFVAAVSNAGDAALPDNLKLGDLKAIRGALTRVVGNGAEGSSADCDKTYATPKQLLRHLKGQLAQIKGGFSDVDEEVATSNGERNRFTKSMPASLLKALGGAVCMTRTAASSGQHMLANAADEIEDFLGALELGEWKEPRKVDCMAEAGETYFCLARVERSTKLYRNALFPVGHLQFWDMASPPLISAPPISGETQPCDKQFAFKFTVPGLTSSYTLQSSTILSIKHTRWCSYIPTAHLLAYRPVDDVAAPNCSAALPPRKVVFGCDCAEHNCAPQPNASECSGRATILAVTDSYGKVAGDMVGGVPSVRVLEIYSPDGFTKWSGSITGLAVRDATTRLSTRAAMVYACGRASDEQDAEWELLRFKMSDLEMPGASTIMYESREAVPWLKQAQATRCTLTYAQAKGTGSDYLWVGAVVSEENADKGEARAYRIQSTPYDAAMAADLLEAALTRIPSATEEPCECEYEDSGGPSVNGGIDWEGPFPMTLAYGHSVQGFAFFDNKFANPHVAIARCTFGSLLPCALEYHWLKYDGTGRQMGNRTSEDIASSGASQECAYGTEEEGVTSAASCGGGHRHVLVRPFKDPPEECQSGLVDPNKTSDCTLSMAVKIPAGIGSLSHDSSLGGTPGQYFQMAFLGTTRENFNTTSRLELEPEDRIFVTRTPILQTQEPIITKNWLQCVIMGDDIFTPTALLNVDLDKDGYVDGARAGTEMPAKSCIEDPKQEGCDSRRQLRGHERVHHPRGSDGALLNALGGSRAVKAAQLAVAPGATSRRRHLQETYDPDDKYGDLKGGCITKDITLSEENTFKPFLGPVLAGTPSFKPNCFYAFSKECTSSPGMVNQDGFSQVSAAQCSMRNAPCSSSAPHCLPLFIPAAACGRPSATLLTPLCLFLPFFFCSLPSDIPVLPYMARPAALNMRCSDRACAHEGRPRRQAMHKGSKAGCHSDAFSDSSGNRLYFSFFQDRPWRDRGHW